MKKVLKKILVNYGGLIFLYLTVIIATFSLISDYKMYANDSTQPVLSTSQKTNM